MPSCADAVLCRCRLECLPIADADADADADAVFCSAIAIFNYG